MHIKYFSYYKWVLSSPSPYTHLSLISLLLQKNVAKTLHHPFGFTDIVRPTWRRPDRTSPAEPHHHSDPTEAALDPTGRQANASAPK